MRSVLAVAALMAASITCTSSPEVTPSPTTSAGSASPTTSIREFDVEVEDGRSIHGQCVGEPVPGAPVIVLDVGMGNDLSELDPVAERLTFLSMVCSYDRAGIVNSDDPSSLPRPIAALVSDLHAFLEGAAIPPPYFLVGHSLGATNVFMFAQRYPEEVAGFVAMNGGPAHYDDWIRAAGAVETKEELQANEIAPLTGDNPEGVDLRGDDGISDLPLPDTMPYAVMYALTCDGDLFCTKIRPVELGTMQAAARVGAGGRLVVVKGAEHEIWVTDLDVVIDTIEEVFAEATA